MGVRNNPRETKIPTILHEGSRASKLKEKEESEKIIKHPCKFFVFLVSREVVLYIQKISLLYSSCSQRMAKEMYRLL